LVVDLDTHKHDTRAIVCSHIVTEDQPVCHVVHHDDGEWQFLCAGGDHTTARTAQIACLGCMRQRHLYVAQLIDELPRGREAWRPSVEEPWQMFDLKAE
jgi:hypothetical protein